MELNFGDLTSIQVWIGAGLIFILRVVDMALATLRFMMLMRGRKGLGWILGFFQAIVFVVAISVVLNDLDNLINILAYAAGYATGGVVGIRIEEKLAVGHAHIRIISPNFGAAIAEKLRAEGYAVTELSGRGKDGTVTLINVSILRKKIKDVRNIVQQVDPNAFITTEDLRPVRRGFWRA